eukprot:TRINITY_DN985_c1_g1_i2.p2 TRINITY_DN985_c1_g1~~TRINITY_DN985_c1_g1_i2.p2  ORF type:complete len:386 (-),score=39.93 TRINITY_DN985_c1_g1_i2:2864-4021(-)
MNQSSKMFLIELFFLCFLTPIFGWRYGRATFYGNEPWYWPIHKNSCGFGYLCKDEGTGWDVAALSDQHPEYGTSCGKCYEVKCNPAFFTDGYGQSLDRSSHCIDPDSSVVITVVDKCPCTYANNAYSNKRWCCGDMDHFDLSVWAFEKIAELKWGVISIQYREVACDYQPAKKAQIPPQGEHWGEEPSAYGASCPQNNFPVYNRDETPAPAPAPVQLSMSAGSAVVVYGDDGKGEFELNSWNAQVWEVSGKGVNGGVAVCGQVHPGGAISLQGQAGAFDGHMMLEFWTSTDQGVANAAVNMQGTKGGCSPLLFQSLEPTEVQNNLAKFEVTLSHFMDGDMSRDPSTPFTGCGQMTAEEIQRVSFHNYEYADQYFCIDEVALKQGP